MIKVTRSVRSLMMLLAMMLFTQVGWGQILLEPFNYTSHASDGLAKQSSGAWVNFNSGDSILIANGSLSYSGLPSSTGNSISYGGSGIDCYRSFTSQTSGTVYASFLLNISSLGSLNTTGGYTIGFLDNGTSNFAGRLWIRLSGTSNFNIGINSGSAAGNTNWASNTLNTSTNYLVVISYQIVSGTSNDVSKIWINPSLGVTEPTADATSTNATATDVSSIQRLFLRQDAAGATPNLVLDEVRVGTSWASVTPGVPSAPTISSITPGDQQLSVAFTAGATGGSAITNYKYSTNGGANWTAVSPSSTSSPIVISGLTNGTSYDVQIRAVNANGDGVASSTTAATPYTTPSAPTITGILAGDQQLSVSFTAPSSTGGSAITNYKYSTDDGSSWTAVSPLSTSSPIIIAGLTNGTTYSVKIRAINAGGDGVASATVQGTPESASGPKCPSSTSILPTADQTVCSGLSSTQLTATIATNGASGAPTYQYQWYYNSTNSNTVSGATLVSGATSSTFTPPTAVGDAGVRYYFCVGYAADNGCGQSNASQDLASGTVKVTVNATPDVPTGSSSQSFCFSAASTVASLSATGSNVSWFSASSGGSALSGSTSLADATTYYAESSSSGCPSASRLAVAVTIKSNPVAPSPTTPQTYCYNSIVSDLQAAGTGILWYTTSSGGASLLASELLSSRSYYATQTVDGCESARSSATVVTVQSAAFSPGSIVQTAANDHLVISQIYGGGGNSGAPYANDFIEIFNPTSSSASLAGYSVQYASAAGTTWSGQNLSGSIAAGKYVLVSLAGGAIGSSLPTADFSGSINMSATAGKVALVSSTTLLSGASPSSSSIVDLVGFGSTASASEGSSPTASPSNTKAILRYAGGYQDLNVNSSDFYVADPAPRNSATAANAGEGGLTQTICSTVIPRKMTIEKAVGSGSYSYQWYYKAGLVADPSGFSTSGWTSLGSSDGANTNAYVPSSTVSESRTYACFVTPGGTPSCGTAQWASGTRQVTVYVANTWYGETSTDWATSGNWGVCGLPAPGSDITIPTGLSTYPTLNSAVSVGTLSIQSAATLTLGTSANLSITGSIVNNGTLDASDGTISLNGTGIQSTSGLPSSIKNLTLNNSTGVTLGADLTVTGDLTLSAGKLSLGNNNLTVNGSISGQNSSNYVVTTGTGLFKRSVTQANTNYVFPVGNLDRYEPVTINFNGASFTARTLGARFIKENPGITNTPPAPVVAVSSYGYWSVTSDVTNTDSYTATFDANYFSPILPTPNFLRLVKRSNSSSSWTLPISSASSVSNGTYLYSLSGTFEGFSEFGVGLTTAESSVGLPVNLLTFSGYKDGFRNQLRWVTVQEVNNSGFEVQRSADGQNYQSIGFVNSQAAGGNSQAQLKYTFTDVNPSGIKQYYRLRQFDIDGRSSLSNILLIQGEKPTSLEIASVYPNPSRGQVTMLLNAPSNTSVNVRLVDLAGRILLTRQINVLAGNNSIPFDLSSLAKGQYLISVDGKSVKVVRE